MTRDDINRLIQDNGLFHGTVKIGVIMDINHLEKFAALVAAQEREACEKEAQERIDRLYMMYEQACQQRDALMDQQRAQIEAMRGRIQ